MHVSPLDLGRLKVFPLAQRKTLTRADEILVDPDAPAKACSEATAAAIAKCARDIQAARQRDASVMLVYGRTCCETGQPGFSNG